ncbi:hypothetical protein ACEPAF_1187 [Sanghuangporus sanghuang]
MDRMSSVLSSASSHRTRTSSYAPSVNSGVNSATRRSLRSGDGSVFSSRSSVTSSSSFSSSNSISSSRSDRTVVVPRAPAPSLASSFLSPSNVSRSGSRAPSNGAVVVAPCTSFHRSYTGSHVSRNSSPVIPRLPSVSSIPSSRSYAGSHVSRHPTTMIHPCPPSVSSIPSRHSHSRSHVSRNFAPVIPPRPPSASSMPPYGSYASVSEGNTPVIPSPPSFYSSYAYGPPVIPPRPSSISPPPSYRTYADETPFMPPRPYPPSASFPGYVGYYIPQWCPPALWPTYADDTEDYSDSYDSDGESPERFIRTFQDFDINTSGPFPEPAPSDVVDEWMSAYRRSFEVPPSIDSSARTHSSRRPESRYSSTYYGSQSRSGRSSRRTRGLGSSSSLYSSSRVSTSTIPSRASHTATDPFVHKVLFFWPDRRTPKLHWDLSRSLPPLYKRRDLTAEELSTSAFTPPLSSVRIILDPHADWKFDVSVATGENFTVSSFLRSIASLMREPGKVPHVFWARASSSKKEAIVKAMLKRAGRSLRVQSPDAPPMSRVQILEEEVLKGARNGSTNLLVIDLLCKEVMFAGLELYKSPDEWVLHTIKRHT